MTDLIKDGYLVCTDSLFLEDLSDLGHIGYSLTGIASKNFPKSKTITDAANRYRRLEYFITHRELLAHLVTNLVDRPVFLQHCDLIVNGFHNFMRHSVDKSETCSGEQWEVSPEFKNNYAVYKVTMFSRKPQMLVRPGTHLSAKSTLPEVDLKLIAGDIVISDARLYTSIPQLTESRTVLTAFFGIVNKHSIKHVKHITETRKDLGYSEINPSLRKILGITDLFHDFTT